MSLTEFFLSLFFPSFCLGCGRFESLLCVDCYQQLNFLTLPIYPQSDKSSLKEIVVMAQYQGLMKKIIHQLKFQSVKPAGQLLGELVYLTTNLPAIDLITAVPLSRKRRRQRGFNQAAVIGQRLAKLTQIPYLPLLRRSRHTAPQASITDRQQRLKRLENCFVPIKKFPRTNSKRVLLVDDVVTTGTTLHEAAKTLRKIGFEEIYGLAAAHGG